MSAIGTLNVKLKADAAGFGTGLSSGMSQLKSFAGGVKGVFASIAAAAPVFFVGKMFKEIDELGKVADQIGVNVTALSELQHAAHISDVSNEELAAGLRILQKHLGEAALGSDEVSKDFEKLGLNAGELAELPLEQALQEIATAIGNLKTPAAQTAASMMIFGKGGAALQPLLKQGASGIRDLMNEAKALGQSMNADVVASVDRADQAIKRMNASVSGLGKDLAGKAAPAVEIFAEGIRAMIQNPGQEIGAALGGKVPEGRRWEDLSGWEKFLVGIGRDLNIRRGPKPAPSEDALLVQKWGVLGRLPETAAEQLEFDRATEILRKRGRAASPAKTGGTPADMARKAADELDRLQGSMKKISILPPLDLERRLGLGLLFTGGGIAAGHAAYVKMLERQRDVQEKIIEQQAAMFEQLRQQGDEAFNATRTPREKFEQDLKDLNELSRKLGPAMDPDVFARRRLQIVEDLIGAAGSGQLRAPEGITRGSAADITLRDSFGNQGRVGTDIASRVERALKRLEDQEKRQAKDMAELVKLFQQRFPNLQIGAIQP